MKSFSLLFRFLIPLFMSAQNNPRNIELSWKTDTTKHLVPLNEFTALMKPDGIPAIDSPKFWKKENATANYFEHEPVIASHSAGLFGGVRAAVHLGVVVGELGMPDISSMLPFPVIGELFNSNLYPKKEKIERSTNRFIDEFLWYIEAFKNQRNKGVPYRSQTN